MMTAFGWLLAAVPRYFQLSRSQWWSAERLESYRQAQLAKTLAAASVIPFYAERFDRRAEATNLASLPILRRADLAELERSVRGLRPSGTRYLLAHSTGTSGRTVELLFDSEHQRGRFAARARYLTENGWRPLNRSVWIIALRPQSTPDWWLTQCRLPGVGFISHVDDFQTQVAWLRKIDPHFLYSLPSNLEGLLSIFAKDGPLRSLRKVFTGGEVLERTIRDETKRILGVEIADNYGSNEMFFAWQCPLGSYHVNAEHVMVEILDNEGNPVSPGQIGRVIATTLENRLMPLVRYDTEDYAVAVQSRCPCGRTLPVIGDIIGRGINLFRLPDGRPLSPWRLLEPLKHLPDLKQVQLVQRKVNEYRVRFVSNTGMVPGTEATIERELSDIVGSPIVVSFERVGEIERAPGGKFMAALCELTD